VRVLPIIKVEKESVDSGSPRIHTKTRVRTVLIVGWPKWLSCLPFALMLFMCWQRMMYWIGYGDDENGRRFAGT
jgi:hypothetical protein